MEKVVQTTLPPSTYTRLWEQAKKEGKPLKTVMRQAIEAYLEKPLPPWEEDPLFKTIGAFQSKEGNWSTRKDWRDPWNKLKNKQARRAAQAAAAKGD